MAAPLSSKRESVATLMSNNASVHPTTSRYYHDFENVELSTYAPRGTQRTLLSRIFLALGMGTRRRKGAYEYEVAPQEEKLAGVLKRLPQREVRSCRRSYVLGFVKRVIVTLPVAVLILFGIIHILQVLIGRSRLFWEVDAHDDYLPNWGKFGHIGHGLASYPTDATRDVLPIPCHSHNDYWRRVPLFDALHWGCTGVEADVWLFDEELYVGHNLAALTRNRTFQNLYVNPLVDLLDKMNPQTDFTETSGHGVFDEAPKQTLVLLVDFKTDGHDTFPVVSQQLEALREKGYLTFWDGEKVNQRAVTVVGTGNTPFDMVLNHTSYRDIFYDAPLNKMWELPRSPIERDDPAHEDDNQVDYGDAMSSSPRNETASGQGKVGTEIVSSPDAFNTSTSYYASTSFTSAVGYAWRGHFSPRQMEIIRGQIRGAKRRGLKVRYWDTPSWPIALRNHVWHVLMKEGADMLNVDDLRAAAVHDWKMRRHDWWR